jgi:transcriptional/translational regulatory protein YebC/TACO1
MEDFGNMQKRIEELGIVMENARLQRIPNDLVNLNTEDTRKAMKAIEAFEDDDDVQNVYHNLEIPDEILAELET